MERENRKKGIKVLFLAVLLAVMFTAVPHMTTEVQAAKTGFQTVSGKTYYIKKDGSRHKGWLTVKGKKYFFNTRTGVMKTGWQKDKKGRLQRYFVNGKGYMVTGFLTSKSGNTRYFNPKTGLMQTGWMKDKKGNKYYFSKTSGVMRKGWVTTSSGKKRYFVKKTGIMKTGLLNLKGKYYYFNRSNGYMYTGLNKVGNNYYYFDTKTGVRAQSTFKTVAGKTYFFRSNGRARTGWLELNGKKYYFNSKGVMYANTTIKVGGKSYKADANGVCTELNQTTTGNGNVRVYDKTNKKYYTLAREYNTHPGVASGSKSDLDLLAALCDAEANDQGLTGMTAVALCVLNRTIKPDKEFPSDLRYAIYHMIPSGSYPQYSPVRDGAMLRRLNGDFERKSAAYKAARNAMKIFEDYKLKRTKTRVLKGFKRKDFDYMYFMTPGSFKSQPLSFGKVISEQYRGHVFFVDWV